ncbi:hypothetical protein GRO01_14170 [Gluconobacter roseus NBRC 3990]|uniref:Uncharacterized protein n=1 Tax=Gluconobacter roseus NBRC 3990 TaxID=1307950 RepID=A0A4Y3M9A1_9PROT|nr:hypothetical protein AA3990_0307 [Gluconobacter roseus NBRC 3990]GEB03841.1 hypothetical protein GRO01_14170 [Gluconobacter roseus NBRC 3990]GLP94295.1 hypothetical protein GCM10007871_22730 [Gluconobacter roseus NBRC 3990]
MGHEIAMHESTTVQKEHDAPDLSTRPVQARRSRTFRPPEPGRHANCGSAAMTARPENSGDL